MDKNDTTESAHAKSPRSRKPRQKAPLKQIESVVDLFAKVFALLTWPVLILIALILFRSPIYSVINLIPGKMEASSEITIGSLLSLKLEEQAKAAGNEELATIIKGLSKEAIEWILKIGDGSHRVVASNDAKTGITTLYTFPTYYSIWIELTDRGLLQSDENLYEFKTFFDSLGPTDGGVAASSLSEQQKARLLANSVELTEAGIKAYEIILQVISDSIGQE